MKWSVVYFTSYSEVYHTAIEYQRSARWEGWQWIRVFLADIRFAIWVDLLIAWVGCRILCSIDR